MSMFLADPRDANMRLGNSIVQRVRKDGSKYPVLLGNIEEDFTTSCVVLQTGEATTLNLKKDGQFCFKPVPLGFCQIGSRARYLMRMPRRRYKQGLNSESLHAEGGSLPRFGDNRFLAALHDTICGNYPTFQQALERVESGLLSSAPFSRNWAVWKQGSNVFLLHKYYGAVGKVEGGIPALDPNWSYLKESLGEEIDGHGV